MKTLLETILYAGSVVFIPFFSILLAIWINHPIYSWLICWSLTIPFIVYLSLIRKKKTKEYGIRDMEEVLEEYQKLIKKRKR
ncbi:MAG: hypothetical protein DRI61_00645 [Chloroflexi bacterium]|nr:MAG: hypothetical protein DRI61_00645 [Chloroflexota bacterium]